MRGRTKKNGVSIHELKTWPGYFNDLIRGDKDFEVRNNDRNFKVGDIIILKEYDWTQKKYSGRQTKRKIKYIFDELGLQKGFVILGLENL